MQTLAHAELATEQRSLVKSLTELDIARRSLQDELHMEIAAALDSATILQDATVMSSTLDQHLISLRTSLVSVGEKLAWVCSEASKENCARCSLEKLVWAKQQRVVDLELALMDSNQAVGEAVVECLMLSSQVRQLCGEKEMLLEQVLNSFSAYICIYYVHYSKFGFYPQSVCGSSRQAPMSLTRQISKCWLN